MTKTQKYLERTKKLMENHGWKLTVPASLLPSEDRAALGGGLRCFRMVHDRKDGKKLETMHRCGNPAAKGSFFCKKKHGGGNQRALVHGNRSMIASAYRGVFKNPIGVLFDTFLNDPSLMDLKPELAALRTCLHQHIQKVSKVKSKKKSAKAIAIIVKYLNNDTTDENDKWNAIKSFCAAQTVLTDIESLAVITKLVDTIGRTIERIDKIQNKEEFMMTPDGLKVLIRCIIDSIRDNVDEATLKKIKEAIITINTRTQGDLTKYKDSIQEASYKMIN